MKRLLNVLTATAIALLVSPVIVFATLVVLLFLSSGCTTTAQAVPKASFRFVPKTEMFEIISPKDTTVENVKFTLMITNGIKTVTLSVGKYSTSMNPAVVEESAAGTTRMINAAGQIGAQMFAAGLSAAAKGAGLPVGPPPLPAVP